MAELSEKEFSWDPAGIGEIDPAQNRPATTVNKAKGQRFLLCTLATFPTIEHDPHHKIVAEILEAMHLAGGREQCVARTNLQPLPFNDHPAPARGPNLQRLALILLPPLRSPR